MKGQKTAKFFVTATVFVLAVVFLSSGVSAAGEPAVKSGEIAERDIALTDGRYTSPEYRTDFAFNVVGFAWQGGEHVMVSMRFSNESDWSEWYSPESTDAIEKDGWHYITEPLVADKATRVQYTVESIKPLAAAKVVYVSGYEQASLSFKPWDVVRRFFLSAARAASNVTILTRADWRADEDWRFDSQGEEVWPTEYAQPKKFVIHHTAGNDGGDNPAATIRGVYYWHAVTLGWGDIGYNYLVDQQGNMYEGRYGGDGVIGAHAYRSKTCAISRFGGPEHEADFNEGTIGIAVLGDYESGSTVTSRVKNALATLIAHEAKKFGIEPAGEGYLADDTYPNIVGHKDLDCTNCPGKNLYKVLATLRPTAQDAFSALADQPSPIIKATYVEQSERSIVIGAGEEKEVWVDFRNGGNVTWRSYLPETIAMRPRQASSEFYATSWNSETEVAKLTTANVPPGEVGRFVFTIEAPTDELEVNEQFILYWGDAPLARTTFSLSAEITGLQYAGHLEGVTMPPATFTNAARRVTLKFKNRGLKTWQRGDVKLNIYDLGDRVSRFYDPSWPDESGRADFSEDSVKPNAVATFTVTMKSPSEIGLYKNIYRLVNGQPIAQSEDYSITRVDSTTQASFVEHNIPPAVLNLWRPTVTVKFKNSGLTTWDHNISLRVYDLGDNVSRFRSRTWPSEFTAVRLSESSVRPGQTGTFSFRFDPPAQPGLYYNRFELIQNGGVVQGGNFSLLTRVDK